MKTRRLLLLPFLALLLVPTRPAFAASTVNFSNPTAIAINDNTTASPYPSGIMVNNPAITVATKIQVLLANFSHAYPKDVDILLVGPQGQRCMLMSDAGGGGPGVMSAILNFSSTFATVVPQNSAPSGNYRPANYANDFNASDLTDSFAAPGPGTLTDQSADLNVFNLTNPNGSWSLYVVDDTTGDVGSIAGGWTLQVTVPTIFTVTNTNDSGGGSLRAALAAAGNDDPDQFLLSLQYAANDQSADRFTEHHEERDHSGTGRESADRAARLQCGDRFYCLQHCGRRGERCRHQRHDHQQRA